MVSFASVCGSSNKDLHKYVNRKLMGCVCAQAKLMGLCLCRDETKEIVIREKDQQDATLFLIIYFTQIILDMLEMWY
jgi:predicted nucleic acid-binding Zn ribbon protein